MSDNGTTPATGNPPKAVVVPERGDVVRRGFGEDQLARSAETASTAMAAHASATVNARHIMAMKQPRDLMVVREKLLRDCSRPAFADAAIYHKPIGKGIEGPSIRLAEAAARAMTNIYTSVTAIYDDSRKRIVKVSATDLESNLSHDKDVTVPKTIERSKLKPGQIPIRQRINSQGDPVFLIEAETDDDILNTENALASKALRVCILRLIPGDILDEAINEAQATLAKKIKDDPDKALKKTCDDFSLKLGIMPAQLAEYLGHPMDKTTIAEIAILKKLFSALTESETTWAEAMDARGAHGSKEKPGAPAGDGSTPPAAASAKTASLTDLAAQSKAKREEAKPAITLKPEDSISKPSAQPKGQTTLPAAKPRGPRVELPDGTPVDLNDPDVAALAATAPTEKEIAQHGPPPVSAREPGDDGDDLPPWAR